MTSEGPTLAGEKLQRETISLGVNNVAPRRTSHRVLVSVDSDLTRELPEETNEEAVVAFSRTPPRSDPSIIIDNYVF